MHRTERVLPVLPQCFERITWRGLLPEALRQVARIIGVSANAEPEDNFPLLPGGELEWNLDRSTRVQSHAHLAGKPGPQHSGRSPKRAVASDKLSAIAAYGPNPLVHIEEGNAASELGVVWIPRQQRATRGIQFGDHMHGRF